MKPNSARRRFVAALALYLIWVGALVAMAVTSSERPPAKPQPPATGGGTSTDRVPVR
jgi:hypothetical protein